MKIPRKTSLAAFVLLGLTAHAQIVLQNFSNVPDSGNFTFFYGTWEATGDNGGTGSPNAQFVQGPGVYDITGGGGIVPTDGAASKLEFFNPTEVDLAANTFLAVTAQTLAGNAAGAFTVFLVDTSGKSAFASFATATFLTGTYTTAVGALNFQSGFDAAAVDSLIISGDQPSGSARFNVSFDQIAAVSAVPEPATVALLAGALALGFVAHCRRRV